MERGELRQRVEAVERQQAADARLAALWRDAHEGQVDALQGMVEALRTQLATLRDLTDEQGRAGPGLLVAAAEARKAAAEAQAAAAAAATAAAELRAVLPRQGALERLADPRTVSALAAVVLSLASTLASWWHQAPAPEGGAGPVPIAAPAPDAPPLLPLAP